MKTWAFGVLFSALCFATHVHGDPSPTGSGSGFLVNSDGWILTNGHVVEGCERVKVPGRGETSDWKIDVANDLAVLRLPGAPVLPLPIRTAGARLGEDVAALGYPLSQTLSSSIKITTGNINSLLGMGDDSRFLQVSTPIQPGSSGGPLVDRSGAVIGVTTSTLKARAAGGEVLPQNVNFAIRGSVVITFLESHGISFEVLAGAGTALSTADLAEKVAQAVVPIICFGPGKPVSAVGAGAIAVTPALPSPFTHVENRDVIGFDYRMITKVSRDECRASCDDDNRCQALTYNKAARVCFLKDGAAMTVRNGDSSASIRSYLAASVYPTNTVIVSGHDMLGGDYARHNGSTFLDCFVTCGKDDRCRAFAYVRKQKVCWLKDRLSTYRKQSGVDLGVK